MSAYSRLARLDIQNWHSSLSKDFSLFALLCLVLVNTLCYDNIVYYRALYPSLYLLVLGLCLVSFSDEAWTNDYSSFFEKALSFLAGISFEFYLFHSLVFHTILPAFAEKNVFLLHAKLLVVGFVLTTICAVGFKRIFERRRPAL